MTIDIFSFVLGIVFAVVLGTVVMFLAASVVGAADRRHKKNESEDR